MSLQVQKDMEDVFLDPSSDHNCHHSLALTSSTLDKVTPSKNGGAQVQLHVESTASSSLQSPTAGDL